jgi:DNA-binding CsgD family transcriptional regulator
VDLLRARVVALSRGNDAPPLLLKAAKRLEPLDVGLARRTYLEAIAAALFAGKLARGGGPLEAAAAARGAPPAVEAPSAPDLLLDGLATLLTEGYAAGASTLKRAVTAFGSEEIPYEDALHWRWLACITAMDLWDDDSWQALSDRILQMARDAGALALLPMALTLRAGIVLFAGEFDAAAVLVEELDAVSEATQTRRPPYAGLALATLRGREADAAALIEATANEVTRRGEGEGLNLVYWARASLDNAAGRHDEALAAIEHDTAQPAALLYARWVLIELIEAAARTGQMDRAAGALERLAETTRAGGTEWALGVEARSRALLSEGESAERLYREAIARLGRTRVRLELARAHLLYGEWLHGERRRVPAREQLRTAHTLYSAMGAGGFAERAARGLRAAGESAHRPAANPSGPLTAQEAQIARLARDGLSNAEIGARLFISPRTVEYHLRKVFGKINIRSRRELAAALSNP